MNKSHHNHKKAAASKKTPETPKDGVDHINIWAKGETELGRLLAHFTRSHFVHPYFGPFNSMEGFWYYIKSEEQDDELRRLSGLEAKNYGRQMTDRWIENFFDIIIAANYHKIDQNDKLRELFVSSTLPFDMYYLHGPDCVLIRPSGYGWLVEGFEKLRKLMKAGQAIEEPDYSKVPMAKRVGKKPELPPASSTVDGEGIDYFEEDSLPDVDPLRTRVDHEKNTGKRRR
jgi:hypothetical protein